MKIEPICDEAFELMLRGSLALADAEEAGIAINAPYYREESERISREIISLKEELDSTPEGKAGKRRYRHKWDVGNNEQIGYALLDCGYEIPTSNKTGKPLSNKDALDEIDCESAFVDGVRRLRKLEQVKNTFIAGLLRNEVGGYVHPIYNLHIPRSYRPSTEDPNLANVPKRDKEIMQLIRRGYRPSKGNVLLEVDYSGNETKYLCSATHDKVMMRDVSEGDMHRDVSCGLFFLDPEWFTKEPKLAKPVRQTGKNGFTFPEFYGSYWFNVAQNIWKQMQVYDLRGPDGAPLRKHLERNGITCLGNIQRDRKGKLPQQPKGAFLTHVKEFEEWFWGPRKYNRSREWQEQWVRDYKNRGWFDMLTGFRCSGVMSRNQLFNYPIQGGAFHWLLWSLIQANDYRKNKHMKCEMVNQVYDSILFDLPPEEVEGFVEVVKRIMEEDILAHWPWINVSLRADFEVSEVNGNWSEMKEIAV